MKPIYIQHRVNRSADLSKLAPEWGVEIDLRSNCQSPGQIHLAHDPWQVGENFLEWLTHFSEKDLKGPLILNTKEDGLEERASELLKEFGVENYFFLDTALPTLVRRVALGSGKHCSVRFSSFEPPLENPFAGKVEWAWVDCFEGKPMPFNVVKKIAEEFKVCLVSPELQGRSLEAISDFRTLLPHASAICTKFPNAWG